EEIKEQKVNVDSLKERTDFLERELSHKSAEFKDANSDSLISYKNVQDELKAGEAAVEVVQLNEYKNGFTGKGSYIAMLIKPEEISLVELGNSDSIAKSISEFRDKIINQKPENEAYAVTWK